MPLNAQGYIGMKFKFKNTLLVSFLAIAGFFGVCSTLISKQVNEGPIAQKAEAVSNTATLYLRPGAWDKDNAKYAAYFYGGSGTQWYNMTACPTKGGETIYKVKQTGTHTYVIFCRMDKSGQTGWTHKWNQSSDLLLSSARSNFFTGINSCDNNQGSWDSVSVCNYRFQTPSNGSVTVALKDNFGTSKGNATLGNADNYIYSDWKVTLTPSPGSGYGFSHWTESEDSGSSYVAWSGSDLRSNPITLNNMSGDVYHGVYFKQYKTVYYITGIETVTTDRVYAWTNYATASGATDVLEYGSFDECWAVTAAANASEVFADGVVHFRGSQNKIYKFSLFSDNFLIRYGNTWQYSTADYSVVVGSGYYSSGQDTDAGAAIALIEAEETARNSVGDAGSIKQYSICGIDKTTAGSLVTTYNTGISSTARGYVNDSTAYTYKGDGTSNQDNISFAAIFNQLAKIASGNSNNLGLYTPFNLMGGEDNFSTIIIVIASSVALLSVTALSILVIRKRKTKEQ